MQKDRKNEKANDSQRFREQEKECVSERERERERERQRERVLERERKAICSNRYRIPRKKGKE